MKTINSFVMLFILSIVIGCANAQKDYEIAKQEDSIITWEHFISEYPGSDYRQYAVRRIEELKAEEEQRIIFERQFRDDNEWAKARETNKHSEVIRFLKANPNSSHTNEALMLARNITIEKLREIMKNNHTVVRRLGSDGGDSDLPLLGGNIPYDLIREILTAFGAFSAVYSNIVYKSGVKYFDSGSRNNNFFDIHSWDTFRNRLLQDADLYKFKYTATMIPLQSSTISGAQSEFQFYGTLIKASDGYKSSISISVIETSKGNIMSFTGNGAIVIKYNDQVFIYALGNFYEELTHR